MSNTRKLPAPGDRAPRPRPGRGRHRPPARTIGDRMAVPGQAGAKLLAAGAIGSVAAFALPAVAGATAASAAATPVSTATVASALTPPTTPATGQGTQTAAADQTSTGVDQSLGLGIPTNLAIAPFISPAATPNPKTSSDPFGFSVQGGVSLPFSTDQGITGVNLSGILNVTTPRSDKQPTGSLPLNFSIPNLFSAPAVPAAPALPAFTPDPLFPTNLPDAVASDPVLSGLVKAAASGSLSPLSSGELAAASDEVQQSIQFIDSINLNGPAAIPAVGLTTQAQQAVGQTFPDSSALAPFDQIVQNAVSIQQMVDTAQPIVITLPDGPAAPPASSPSNPAPAGAGDASASTLLGTGNPVAPAVPFLGQTTEAQQVVGQTVVDPSSLPFDQVLQNPELLGQVIQNAKPIVITVPDTAAGPPADSPLAPSQPNPADEAISSVTASAPDISTVTGLPTIFTQPNAIVPGSFTPGPVNLLLNNSDAAALQQEFNAFKQDAAGGSGSPGSSGAGLSTATASANSSVSANDAGPQVGSSTGPTTTTTQPTAPATSDLTTPTATNTGQPTATPPAPPPVPATGDPTAPSATNTGQPAATPPAVPPSPAPVASNPTPPDTTPPAATPPPPPPPPPPVFAGFPGGGDTTTA
jgi:hypothetical protein